MADRRIVVPEFKHTSEDGTSKGGRLGRNVEHDERSRRFMASVATLVTTMHKRHAPPWDQGDVGACTGYATVGTLMTEPIVQPDWALGPRDALKIYSQATRLDGFPGTYPPLDTGSSGLAAMKAAVKAKYIRSYTHTFSLQDLLGALVLKPGIIGIPWYDSFDEPLATGECVIAPNATVRGGHEMSIWGIDVTLKRVWAEQSWGANWGGLHNGTLWFAWATLERLLKEQGDATFPVV